VGSTAIGAPASKRKDLFLFYIFFLYVLHGRLRFFQPSDRYPKKKFMCTMFFMTFGRRVKKSIVRFYMTDEKHIENVGAQRKSQARACQFDLGNCFAMHLIGTIRDAKCADG